jgi:outer membrane protein OmpA-like peptidoglycan-associated protein
MTSKSSIKSTTYSTYSNMGGLSSVHWTKAPKAGLDLLASSNGPVTLRYYSCTNGLTLFGTASLNLTRERRSCRIEVTSRSGATDFLARLDCLVRRTERGSRNGSDTLVSKSSRFACFWVCKPRVLTKLNCSRSTTPGAPLKQFFHVASLAAVVALAGCKTMPQQDTASVLKTVAAGIAPTQPVPVAPANAGCTHLPGYEPKSSASTNNMLIGGAVGAVAGAAVGRSAADKKSVGTRNGALVGALLGALAGSQFGKDVQVKEQDDGIVKMNIPGSVLFQTGRADLNPEFQRTLDGVAKVLVNYCGITALVVGHTDSTGSVAVNDKLSMDRAISVVSYLSSRFPRDRIQAEGRAAREPVASNDDANGRAMNRRVEIFIKPPQMQ